MIPLDKLEAITKRLATAQKIMKELYNEYGITFLITEKEDFPEGELGMIIDLDTLEETP